jgi:hypothetical protein
MLQSEVLPRLLSRVVSIIGFVALALSGVRAQEPLADAAAVMAVVNSVPPLTPHERWHGYWHENLLGSVPALRIFGSAFLEHIGREPREWGLGAHGYTHRVENRLYRAMVEGTVHSALHHETRYLPLRQGSGANRVRHAIERTFVTTNDSGGRVFDISGLGGIYAGTMLPMYWHPRRYSPLAHGVRAGNMGVTFQAGSNLFKEFQPDLKRLIAKR